MLILLIIIRRLHAKWLAEFHDQLKFEIEEEVIIRGFTEENILDKVKQLYFRFYSHLWDRSCYCFMYLWGREWCQSQVDFEDVEQYLHYCNVFYDNEMHSILLLKYELLNFQNMISLFKFINMSSFVLL